tara:strand:- start:365 stop:829 length:465 start_codon:yes stop_codon:yes gene_type:complete
MPIYNSNSRGYVGLRNVGSYQVSGTPFITGSTNLDDGKVHRISFPYVTKSITIINTSDNSGEDIDIHFSNGSVITDQPKGGGIGTFAATDPVVLHGNYITIPAGNGSLTMDIKCKKFFVSNRSGTSDLSYQVLAELTQIPTGSMYELTGSGINL